MKHEIQIFILSWNEPVMKMEFIIFALGYSLCYVLFIYMVLLILKKLIYFVLGVIDTVLLILGEFFKECQPKKRIN